MYFYKKIFNKTIILLSALYINSVSAQTNNLDKIICSYDYIINILCNEYDEKPVIVGKLVTGTRIVLLFNQKTKTWSIVKYVNDESTIFALGEDIQLLNIIIQK